MNTNVGGAVRLELTLDLDGACRDQGSSSLSAFAFREVIGIPDASVQAHFRNARTREVRTNPNDRRRRYDNKL